MLRKLLFCLILLTVFPAAAQDRTPIQTDAAVTLWREDLDFMMQRLEGAHPNLYWRFPQETFQEAFQALWDDVPYLTDEQIQLGILRFVAMIDGHTHVEPFQQAINFHVYPLQIYHFTDGLYVIDAQRGEWIGSRLVSINGQDAETLYQRMLPYAPYDNALSQATIAPLYLMIPEALHGMGFIADVNQPNITLEMPDGELETINPRPQTINQFYSWHESWITGLPERDVMYLNRFNHDLFWFEHLEDSDTLYIQYNMVMRSDGGETINRFADSIRDYLEANNPARIVVDVRHNGGGDNTTYHSLIGVLRSSPHISEPGRFFLITSRHTFSAAKDFVGDLLRLGGDEIITVGEPTGGSPNNYGQTYPFTLPNSDIQVNVSTRFVVKGDGSDDSRVWFDVDVPAPLSSQDFFADVDPALAVILAT